MLFSFSKYTGCGNDFILIDNRRLLFPSNSTAIVSRLCHRQQGIGADGIILLEESGHADFKMRIFNADGSEAEMCGNGIRCLMKFIKELGFSSPRYTIETMERLLTLQLEGEEVCVEMGDPDEGRWNLSIESEGGAVPFLLHHLNTGVPHAILFKEEIESFDLHYWGPKIRHHPMFHPRGTNVNVATLPVKGTMAVRTYERGVEGETLACGTGATAVALAAAYLSNAPSPIRVKTKLGDVLTIGFERTGDQFSRVTMTGPAKKVYTGEVEITG